MWNNRVVITEFFYMDSTLYVANIHEVYYCHITGLPNGLTERPLISTTEYSTPEEAVDELKRMVEQIKRSFELDYLSPIEAYMPAYIHNADEKKITVFDRDDAYFDEMYGNDSQDDDDEK